MNLDNNKNDIDNMIDDVLASEQQHEQTMIDLSALPSKSSKDSAIDKLFFSDPKEDLEYINSLKQATPPYSRQNKEAYSDSYDLQTQTKEEMREEKKLKQEFEKFDEEINYRKKLETIMKRSTPTEPFAMKVVEEEESVLSSTTENAEDSNEFEYYSHEKMGKFDKISVRTYSGESKPSSYSVYLLKNKLLFATMLIIFGIYLLEIGIFAVFMRDILQMNYLYYMILLFVAMIPLGVGVFKYSLNPDLKVKNKMNFVNMTLNSIIVVVLAVVVLIIITLFTSTSIFELGEFMTRILIPLIMILNYPIGILIYYLLYKSERFFE